MRRRALLLLLGALLLTGAFAAWCLHEVLYLSLIHI